MNFKKNKIFSSFLIIFTGTAFAQLLNILFSPIITRIYTPEEFGIVAIFTVFIGLFSIATLKYEMAIPIAKSDNQALILFISSVLISIFFNLLLLLNIFLFRTQINNIFGFENFEYIVLLIPLGALLISLFNISREWAIRKNLYKEISKASVIQSASGNIAKVIFGLLGFSVMGLAVARIVTGSLGFLSLAKGEFSRLKNILRDTKLKDIFNVLYRFKDFAFYMAPNSLIVVFATQFPLLTISVLFEPETVGYYSLAHTIIMLPIAIIGDSIADVFYSESAKSIKNKPLSIIALCKRVVLKMALISFIPAIILILLGPRLFVFIFGNDWYYAGVFSQLLSIVLIAKMTFHPVNKIFELIEKQKYKFYINLIQILLLCVLFVISYSLNIEPVHYIFIYSCIIFFMNGILFTWSYVLLKRYVKI
ncbi:hypothetical protein JEOAER750_01043 [Jeotgalicoccus aerolatus]|uniref:O-antigen/teichoic acid export membrane protein n=1 Tax=Jeotgalicoccus aerolatus TaxID=709510 RepID=A0ABS4HMN8_9STAP|nr:oligosaccharide flippase family protein [Jeotgalicoccus aerolatus]MBP1951899.1 O-antigen/teichoic acid export membrane protein [Jeotgalicoccus aerolatus]GGD93866.1 polysaccharide biosynthesis protein [Jeotgalicoccus aerolatus]CAD2074893.1 hypothetical protein JEOAER750_01043 [Jeotgalicoccus aerolatus]